MQLPIIEAIGQDQAGRARVVKVNVDEEPELTRQFGVASIPTLLVFSRGQAPAVRWCAAGRDAPGGASNGRCRVICG